MAFECVKQYKICSSDFYCPDDYVHLKGDIENATIQDNIPATKEECATLCDNTKECMSFKHGYDHKFHSYYNKKELCYLNTENKDNIVQNSYHPNFDLCFKKEGKALYFIITS